ncbi:MAG: helix-turn-helix transcriptional regulator [Saprospiraceae bacterium]|nr:helix-turn-helix transcriptional regulator [Saprospiraceae bacterium]MCF8250209.1 helix-turn-helix transcriptional regulator [Saprospiraceae bacterium]MCF8280028.1 helix-turn-helix transcriptional regulator [Bacteroidales bacterium]MCF8312017.1 helix-turn-helix transcriptional regulator [Saprospiraceae bacterium]MCF8441114.1 helix-turn-helix transcriptional regulator [Saprospiraceae bacterium]
MRNKLFQEVLEQVPEHTRVFVRKYGDIIDRIYELMEERGFSEKDLANKMGKTESEISEWLRWNHILSLRMIAELEVALGGEIICVPSGKKDFQDLTFQV